ncbi:hypothetical protein GSI_01296 [Ganoderma sinense ZZ0214-1]|uniref:Uncharacterized protein n=1 Tax=Ganoderma sinense ZZ0214-1 TaxID=1077348 RepID=A0A2G8SV42_9APHY|nr:hypothetical protein GSI_01296 [Ganoderma sinense ZZ0214-1]
MLPRVVLMSRASQLAAELVVVAITWWHAYQSAYQLRKYGAHVRTSISSILVYNGNIYLLCVPPPNCVDTEAQFRNERFLGTLYITDIVVNTKLPAALVGSILAIFYDPYLVCVQDGTKNPHRGEVANDLVDAILKAKAANGVPAIYHPQAEQEERLVKVYNKWKEHGGVWTAAAAKVHAKQLTHVQKGCLARPRNDIPTDGSRIEGSHKGWNSIMRAFPSGLEVMNALGHDHVLRHNVRLDMRDGCLDKSMFMYYTFGSHHIRLVNAGVKLWNTLIEAQKKNGPLPANIRALPALRPADSQEKFGLVKMSAETATQYSLATIKQEPGDEAIDLSPETVLDADRLLQEIGVDPALLAMPRCCRRGCDLSPLGPPVLEVQMTSPS